MFNLSEYTTVSERIKLFREMYPMGRIITTLISEDPSRVVFKAEFYRDDEDQRPFSTGYAREITAERGVNKDFALENCETSAIGIAAKNANIGTEKNAISREEAEKVNRVKAKDAGMDDLRLLELIQRELNSDEAVLELLKSHEASRIIEVLK